MKKTIILVIGLVLISLFTSSCSKDIVDDPISTNNSPEEQIINEQEYEWTEKYNLYVDYSNWAGSTLRTNTILEYVNKFGSEEEFTKPQFERDASLTVLAEYNFNIVDRTTESAKNGMNLGEIDNVVLQNIDDTLKYMELWNEIADYYRNDKYKEDEYGKSQQYHETLFYSYFEMIESFDLFADYFEELVIESELKEVEALKEDGFLTLAAAYSLIMDYKSILRLFPNDEYWNDDFFAVSLADYESCYNKYLTDLGILETYLNDEEQTKNEGLTSGQISQMKAIIDVAGEMSMPYVEDIGKLLEAGSLDAEVHDPHLRNNTSYNPVDNLSGLLKSIVSYYNSAVS